MIALVSRSSMFSTSIMSGFSTRILTVIMGGGGAGPASAFVADDFGFETWALLALDDLTLGWLESEVEVTTSTDASSDDVGEGAIPLVKKSATFIK